MLWYLVKDLLLQQPHISDKDMVSLTYSKFGYELPNWLISEARFVHSQKIKRGEIPPPGGHVSLEQAQQTFVQLSVNDRAKFLDWAQFTMRQLTG